MPEQLNERERWLMAAAYDDGYLDCHQGVRDRSGTIGLDMRLEDLTRKTGCPPDPNLARITELEAEVARLNALLDVIEAVLLDDFDLKTERCEDILSRRTAERKERGDV